MLHRDDLHRPVALIHGSKKDGGVAQGHAAVFFFELASADRADDPQAHGAEV